MATASQSLLDPSYRTFPSRISSGKSSSFVFDSAKLSFILLDYLRSIDEKILALLLRDDRTVRRSGISILWIIIPIRSNFEHTEMMVVVAATVLVWSQLYFQVRRGQDIQRTS